MFSFGTDPEFMVQQNGQYISAVGLVPGTKDKRYKIGNHAIFCDNVLAECELKPGNQKDEVIINIKDCLQRSARLISPAKLTLKSAQRYPKQELNTIQALECGCDHEWCAYKVALVSRDKVEKTIKKSDLRVAGGHIHLGDDLLMEPKQKTVKNVIDRLHRGILPVVRMLDLFVGIPAIYLNRDSTSSMRMKLYGAGRYRKPSHGVEYRTMGNFWLESPKMVSLIFDLCEFVIKFVKNEQHDKLWQYDGSKIWLKPESSHICIGYDQKKLKQAIETCNKKFAHPFIGIIKQYLPAKLFKEMNDLIAREPKDFYQEWCLAV